MKFSKAKNISSCISNERLIKLPKFSIHVLNFHLLKKCDNTRKENLEECDSVLNDKRCYQTYGCDLNFSR